MLDYLNNIWVILICIVLLYFIFKKICNLWQPFDEEKFIKQMKNQEKFEEKFSLSNLPSMIPSLTSMYIL